MFGQIGQLSLLFGGNVSDSGTQLPSGGGLVDVPLRDVIDSVYGYASYSFGETRDEGLTLTAGWKTWFSGYNTSSRPRRCTCILAIKAQSIWAHRTPGNPPTGATNCRSRSTMSCMKPPRSPASKLGAGTRGLFIVRYKILRSAVCRDLGAARLR